MSEESDMQDLRFVVFEDTAMGRLDKILSALCEEYSRSRIQKLIEDGQVRVNGVVYASASQKVSPGDVIEMNVPPPVEAAPQAQDIPLDIVYEDEHLLVINKPAGLVVHPGAGNFDGTLVNALLHHCAGSLSGIGGVLRPGIVHRLDKDTSGLIVAAKSDEAHRGLAAQLEDRSLSRLYTALVLKVPVPMKGMIDLPIGRDSNNRLKMGIIRRGGKEARTFYRVEQNYRDALALVECKLESGRTHQIRVHMEAIKHPLIGDPLYGPQPTALSATLKKAGYEESVVQTLLNFPRQILHARALAFIHPVSGEAMNFTAELPEDISNILKLL